MEQYIDPSGSILLEILAERRKAKFKYSEEHDDKHVDHELTINAAELCFNVAGFRNSKDPWKLKEKYKNDHRKQLVIAAALIVAELERRNRAD